MSPDLQQLSDLVVLAIKAAQAPILERLAATEQRARDLESRLQDQATVRDRVVALEVKAGLPVARVFDQPGDLVAVDGLTKELGALRERLAVLEVRAAIPGPAGPPGKDGRDGAIDTQIAGAELDALTKDLGALRERVAVVEVRQPVPGPTGPAGHDGAKGQDGRDGLGFDDLNVTIDERTLTLTFAKGATVRKFPVDLPFIRYTGVYQDHVTYNAGDLATYGGSTWHCNSETTSKPGDGSKAWTLMVKRGRDGRDGIDPPAVPVVKVG